MHITRETSCIIDPEQLYQKKPQESEQKKAESIRNMQSV